MVKWLRGMTFDSFELRLAQRVNFYAGVWYLRMVLQHCNAWMLKLPKM
jgi:hypothetical protein